MSRLTKLLAVGFIALSTTLLKADTLDPLGSSNSFAVLAASTVTNTGASVLSGNLGVSPNTAITGFPPGLVLNGTIHTNDGVAILALADALSGYNTLAGLTASSDLSGQDLGGLTLFSGVYRFTSQAQLTGDLTIDFQGIDNAEVVFQIGSALTTASASQVNVLNAGVNDRIYWQVGSSATLGTTSAFQGFVLAGQSVSLDTGASIQCGSAIALTGAVTLESNTIETCPAVQPEMAPGTSTGTGDPQMPVAAPVPEPATIAMFGTGVLGLVGAIRRKIMA